ncbi:PotD/PotF family extracellular solute-binding protein [Halobacterium salinarum]|uniref:ABC transporter substrate-binding protein n=1 Tax=Halobacterium salinarum TaxID=2242 RepID=UPI001F35357E|nr:PotD/PotF family extracellular solute-binding protein [Halobacterium salinarum]MCF2207297.1 PotD/PotF family extracellular solute-binding protein [Halobacterium salinarum]
MSPRQPDASDADAPADTTSDAGHPHSTVGRRSFLAATGAAASATALAGCLGGTTGTPTINVLTWEHYARDDVAAAVEDAVDATVNVTKSISSEKMFAGWQAGKDQQFDIAIPNNNYVPKFAAAGLAAPVPVSDLDSYPAIYDFFKNAMGTQLAVDGTPYGVPIRFGYYGYGYDSRAVPDHDPSWSVLFDGIDGVDLSSAVALYDNHFKAMSAAALHLGFRDAFDGDRITLSESQLGAVTDALIDQKQSLLSGYIAGDASFVKGITKGDFHVGHTGRMNVTNMRADGTDWIEMATPTEGALSWFEAAVVSTQTDHPDLAWEVVNEYIAPETGATLAREGHAPSVNPETTAHLSERRTELYGAIDPARLADMIPSKAVANEDAWRAAWERVKTA